MCKGKISKKIIGVLLVAVLFISNLIAPIQSVLADIVDGAQAITRGAYFELPESVPNYATSGKTIEFDLNVQIASTDVCKLGLYNGSTMVSSEFFLRDGENGISVIVEPTSDGWYHYVISLATVPRTDAQATSTVTRMRARTNFPTDTKIKNITVGIDVRSLPEAFTEDFDTVTLADLGMAGTDYKTPVQSGSYSYKGTSDTYSVIVKLGWEANVTNDIDWKLSLDTYWNANCMVWFRDDAIYFCPGQGTFNDLAVKIKEPVTTGKHDLEFGRLRVTAGSNYGMDYVFFKIDGVVKASKYTKHYQTEGGYDCYDGKIYPRTYTVHFVNEGVAKQGFSGFAKPDEFVTDIDYINLGDVIPGGVAKDTIHDGFLGYTYPATLTSATNSTVVKYVIKTGDFEATKYDGSVMVVDIGGNCGFCRSYIPSGSRSSIMFGWEIEGCTSGTKKYTFEGNSWYAVEQGRIRVASGINQGKDYIYLKINGELVSSFYGNPQSRPLGGKQIYVEATQNIQIVGYDELRAKYYVDDELYLDQLAQKGFTAREPASPTKTGQYFVGWYTAKTGGKLFDFKNTKLTANINLYARFTSESVKATFKNNNGNQISRVNTGKGCLVTKPADPSYAGSTTYQQVFVGWKNETTGKIFNFETDRISEDTIFTAQYKEKEYFVSYYANGKLVKTVPFVLSNPTVSGKEPAVPAIANTTGAWEEHPVTGLTKNITVNAVYTVNVPASNTAIKLTDKTKVYLNTDMIHDYLSTETSKQTSFVREYASSVGRAYQDYQNTSFKWTDSGSNSKYTVYFADNADFKNAYIVTTSKKSLVNEVGIFVPGKTYYWFVTGNSTGKSSAVDSFTVIDSPIRYITAGNVINMRDLGGQITEDGDKVKYELVYRGAALDEYTSHVDDAARYVFEYLGMNSEIELRGGMDHDYTGWDENNDNVYYAQGAAYQEIFGIGQNIKNQYKAFFDAMADESNYPFYFHCSAGADRTGTLAFLIYSMLGVSYDDIRPEYELTTFSAIGLRAADFYQDGLDMDGTRQRMLAEFGDGSDDLQVAVTNYLTNYIGISDSTIQSIQNIMLEKDGENETANKITVDVLGKTYTYYSYDGVYFMPEAPQAMGKLFVGFYKGSTKYNGYTDSDVKLVAKFEDIQFEHYDTISLKDLGIEEEKIINTTNSVYTYEKTATSGGRLLQFTLEPIGNMNNGDGPQLALTNDWSQNSYARVWFQTNTMSHVYYGGALDAGPDVSKMLSLEAGKQYDIEFAVRVMKNKGYEGKKILEITVNGELFFQYIGCKADLSDNKIFFHGGTGSGYLINKPVYKTVKFYNGKKLIGTYQVERSTILPQVKTPAPKNGVPFAGWYTKKTGGELWDENADLVLNDMSLYAHFAFVKVIKANVDGKILTYRVEVGKTLEDLPKPQKPGHVFMGWAVKGNLFEGPVRANLNVTAVFEEYSFDAWDEISLRDLGIYNDFEVSKVSETNTKNYTYRKAAKTGGRVFKAIYIPTENMLNGPQISFSPRWDENYFAKLYFTKFDTLYVYSSGIDGGLPTFTLNTDILGGQEYEFEIGVRVLNNKGYKGVKVLTVYLNGELIFEEFDNRANIEGADVFFQGMPNTGVLRNINIYNTVSFYNGDKLLKSVKVLRGETVKSYGKLANKGDRLFMGWRTEYGEEWDFETDCVYLDTDFKAKFQKRTYPVLLMVDGILYKRLAAFAGESIDIFDIPTKEGYEFDKWLTEDGKEYNAKTLVKAPITLVASFNKIDSVVQNENVTHNESDGQNTFNLKHILFGIFGLIVIAIETTIIFVIGKKRSKNN